MINMIKMAKTRPIGDNDKSERSESKTNIPTETIKAIVESAIQQNPIVFKRLAEI